MLEENCEREAIIDELVIENKALRQAMTMDKLLYDIDDTIPTTSDLESSQLLKTGTLDLIETGTREIKEIRSKIKKGKVPPIDTSSTVGEIT